jgi:hypothetical protein
LDNHHHHFAFSIIFKTCHKSWLIIVKHHFPDQSCDNLGRHFPFSLVTFQGSGCATPKIHPRLKRCPGRKHGDNDGTSDILGFFLWTVTWLAVNFQQEWGISPEIGISAAKLQNFISKHGGLTV